MSLTIGSQIPLITSIDQNGAILNLSDLLGKWLVLYFYPKDNTPGCTTEACVIRDNYSELISYAVVMGVSADSSESHKRFIEKYKLPFTLLSDQKKDMINAFGADGIIMPKRITFIIDPEGKIAKIYPKVSPDMHAKQLIDDLKALQSQ